MFDDLSSLILPGRYALLVCQRQVHVMRSRVRALSPALPPLRLLFSCCCCGTSSIDLETFPWPLWGRLSALRCTPMVGFTGILWFLRNNETICYALLSLMVLQIIPTIFLLAFQYILSFYAFPENIVQMFAASHQFLPYIIATSLAVLPITLLEDRIYPLLIILVMIGVIISGNSIFPFSSVLNTLWLLLLLLITATAAGMSQLHFITSLVNESARDALTIAYTRRIGEGVLEVMFTTAVRRNEPIVVAFFDLDNFKSVNDIFGHQEGDRTLCKAAEILQAAIRRHDVLVRWGGEEFLVIMPFIDGAGAAHELRHLQLHGLGHRPDGGTQTASVGIAERLADECGSWQMLVKRADHRMYMAKQGGKNRIVLCDDSSILLDASRPPVNHLRLLNRVTKSQQDIPSHSH